MTITHVRQKIKIALDLFYSENSEILTHWKTSRSYVCAFAKVLEKEFESWDIDCFFVHYNQSPTFGILERDGLCNAKDCSTTCEECLNQKWCKACPDIVIHHRNAQDNLLIIQTELSCRNQSKIEQDLLKIEAYINKFDRSYAYGLFINWAQSLDQVSLRWRSHSILNTRKTLENKM